MPARSSWRTAKRFLLGLSTARRINNSSVFFAEHLLGQDQGGRMRYLAAGLCGIVALGLCAFIAFGQGGRGEARKLPAPTDQTLFSTMAEMQQIGRELLSEKGPAAEHRFFREQSYNMEVRRLSGPQPILLHGKK